MTPQVVWVFQGVVKKDQWEPSTDFCDEDIGDLVRIPEGARIPPVPGSFMVVFSGDVHESLANLGLRQHSSAYIDALYDRVDYAILRRLRWVLVVWSSISVSVPNGEGRSI